MFVWRNNILVSLRTAASVCDRSEAALSIFSLQTSSGSVSLEINSCVLVRGTMLIFFVNSSFTIPFSLFYCVCVCLYVCVCFPLWQIWKQITSRVFHPLVVSLLFVCSDADWKGFTVICRHITSVDGIVNNKELAFLIYTEGTKMVIVIQCRHFFQRIRFLLESCFLFLFFEGTCLWKSQKSA